jgi:circadian clock protein KaiB
MTRSKRPSSSPDRHSRKLFELSLYVAGTTSRSLRTIQSVKRAFEEHAQGKYDLRVVDIHRHPALAVANQIVAVPTLVCSHPKPVRCFVGHALSSADVLQKLRIIPMQEQYA